VRRPLFLLLLATFALKAAVLAHFNAHPLLQPTGDMDSGVYARLAADVARGDLLLRGPGPVPFFVSPLYIYFLAAIHALGAGSLLAAKLVQIALGTAAAGLVYGMTRRLFGGRAALFAGVLYALTGVVTFHEVLILQAALDPFLTALFLYLMAVGLTSGSFSSKVWVAAGAAGGLLALNRPNALLCVAALSVVLLALAASSFVARRRSSQPSLPFEENPLRTFRFAMTFLAGTAVVVALPLVRNLIVSGEPVLISSHGGLNFLVGNGPGANGVYRVIPGITPDIGGQAQDAKRVAEAAEGRTLSTEEVSAHFAKEAWTWIREKPGAAAELFFRKLWYVLSRDEAPLNFSFPWYRERSVALKLLFVGPGLLVPLAGAGFVLALFATSGAARRALLVWAVFVPAYVLAVAAFFVATRYRLPLLVALAPLGGAAVAGLPAARQAKGRGLALAASTAAVLAAVSLWPTGLWDGAADEDMHWALYLVEKGDPAEAARVAEAAAARHPDPGLVWFRMGRAWAAAKRMDDAIAALEKALAIQPHPPATETALAAAHESRGVDRVLAHDALAALPDLEVAVTLSPEDPGMLLNLAAVLAEKGERERARELARKSLALRPGYDRAEALLRALK
jgi:cytochrome c-type biogenesis protein CcmH/NrfG